MWDSRFWSSFTLYSSTDVELIGLIMVSNERELELEKDPLMLVVLMSTLPLPDSQLDLNQNVIAKNCLKYDTAQQKKAPALG